MPAKKQKKAKAKKAKKTQEDRAIVAVRLDPAAKKACMRSAKRYAGGNLSQWVRFASTNFKPTRAQAAALA